MPKKPVKPNSQRIRDYARFSGMGLQLGVLIALGAFAGRKIDAYLAMERPIFTALLALLATVVGVYSLIRAIVQTK